MNNPTLHINAFYGIRIINDVTHSITMHEHISELLCFQSFVTVIYATTHIAQRVDWPRLFIQFETVPACSFETIALCFYHKLVRVFLYSAILRSLTGGGS